MVKILVGCTGSVATIKLPNLIEQLLENIKSKEPVEIQVIVTENAKHFFNTCDIPKSINIYSDKNEWAAWKTRGDPVLHIDLGKWADVFLIAPLDANTLAKISNGLCDNLLTCAARAWEMNKPLIFCPAMNTKMYNHPLTNQQINTITKFGYHHIPVIEKTLICGDTGPGAMAEVGSIVNYIQDIVSKNGL